MKTIQSVERAMNILELLDDSGGSEGLGVLDLSRLTGLKQPTVHNFLQTLLVLGYVSQDQDTSKYMLADSTRFLGWKGGAKRRLADIARPIATELFNRFNETVVMTTPEGNMRTTLFAINSSRQLSVRYESHMDSRFYSSATGRCILSRMSGDELERVISRNGLPYAGEWEGADTKEGIYQELEKIRRKNYALYDHSEEIMAVGVSVFSEKSRVNAGLGFSVPKFRFTGELKKEIIKGLQDTAQEIMDALNA